MKSKTNGTGTSQAAQKTNVLQGEGPNWVFVVGGALLSTLSIKLGCQLKRAFDNKRHDEANKGQIFKFLLDPIFIHDPTHR